MISCLSESSGALQESLRTLRFSMSAARIRNKPIRFLDPQEKLILELREEIKRLRMENKQLRFGMETGASRSTTSVDGGLEQHSRMSHEPAETTAEAFSPEPSIQKVQVRLGSCHVTCSA